MNRFRCLLLGAMVVISSSMFALGGEMQTPGKSEPSPSPTPASASTTKSTTNDTAPTTTEGIQIVWPDATTMLVEILLTIF